MIDIPVFFMMTGVSRGRPAERLPAMEVAVFLSTQYTVVHYYHSGFSVASGDTLLVFDYWRGEDMELAEDRQLSEDQIRSFANVVVFISHEHIDHLDPIVFTWKDLTNVSYIVSSDMPVGTRGKRMAPGDTYSPVPGVDITAFDSTDLGVSFLVDFTGLRIFHAGDLNFWHWREESSMQDIEEADAEFRKVVSTIQGQDIDIAFFPVDPRQGAMYEAGANYFIMTVKPQILVPMHYFHRADVALEYARTASSRDTEVIAMPLYGDTLRIETDDEGYLNVTPVRITGPAETAGNGENGEGETETGTTADFLEPELDSDNPFYESDLPIPGLSENGEDEV